MKQLTATTATIAALVIVAFASTADAGGYVSLGLGADATLSGDMAAHFSTDGEDSSSGRIALGQRTGRIAIEVALYGADVQSTTSLGGMGSYSTATLGVAIKYFVPVSGRLEAYGKIGLDKTYLVAEDDTMSAGYSGRGHNLGGGLQYRFQAAILGSAAIWLDYTHQTFQLFDSERPDSAELDGGAQLLTLGVSLGF